MNFINKILELLNLTDVFSLSLSLSACQMEYQGILSEGSAKTTADYNLQHLYQNVFLCNFFLEDLDICLGGTRRFYVNGPIFYTAIDNRPE